MIDFTNCPNGFRDYGGSDSKRSIEYNGKKYMLKLPEKLEKTNDLQTSHVNNVFSEYLGSHIIKSLDLPVHNTIIGIYENAPVIACEDFTGNGYRLQEFSWMMRSLYPKEDIGRFPTYKQLYDVIERHPLLEPIKEKALKRYWETFVADALIGNFDRHKGNFGYLVNETTKNVKLAPIYDCGSCLYPSLTEKKMTEVLSSRELIKQRIYEFPKSALNLNNNNKKVEKAGYYDFIASGQDKNCTNAFAKIYPHIDMDKIDKIVENTPFLTDIRINFYKSMLHYRKELILDKALEQIRTPELIKMMQQEKYNMEVEKLKTEYDRQNKSIFSLDYKLALTEIQEKCENLFLQNEELETDTIMSQKEYIQTK